MRRALSAVAIGLLLLAGCKGKDDKAAPPPKPAAAKTTATPAPTAAAQVDPKSAQGAAQVLQMYYAYIGDADYEDAWGLWADGGKASGLAAAAFAQGFDAYESYHATAGPPGRIDGAAGSLFVEIPIELHATRKDGSEQHARGSAVLRRVNDVPGATPEQLLWRIEKIDLQDQ